MATAPEQFISERITPDPTSFDPTTAAIGEPALPMRFTWRKRLYSIRTIVRRWKEYEPDRTHGSGELYLRRHWLEVEVDGGTIMKIYFARQPGPMRSAKARWWIYSTREP